MAKALCAIEPDQSPMSHPGLSVTLMGRGIVELEGSYTEVFKALVNLAGYSEEEAAQAIINGTG